MVSSGVLVWISRDVLRVSHPRPRYCSVDSGECMDKNGHGTDLWSRMQKSRKPSPEFEWNRLYLSFIVANSVVADRANRIYRRFIEIAFSSPCLMRLQVCLFLMLLGWGHDLHTQPREGSADAAGDQRGAVVDTRRVSVASLLGVQSC